MSCYKLIDGVFRTVEEPIDSTEDGDYDAMILKSGYGKEISSRTHESSGAEITLFSTSKPGKPMYFIDIMGLEGQLATVVADDFPALVSTLKELGPLIALMGLDQRADIQAEQIVSREVDRRLASR